MAKIPMSDVVGADFAAAAVGFNFSKSGRTITSANDVETRDGGWSGW